MVMIYLWARLILIMSSSSEEELEGLLRHQVMCQPNFEERLCFSKFAFVKMHMRSSGFYNNCKATIVIYTFVLACNTHVNSSVENLLLNFCIYKSPACKSQNTSHMSLANGLQYDF